METNGVNGYVGHFRALIATDIHLGFAESDPLRGDDTFNTFEEVLQIATQNDVDFVILGGDLFHENRPSSKSMTRCVELLRKYCGGDKAIQFEIVSDQKENFKHTQLFPFVNYQDLNLNISIPVFSIHGNHDDPIGRHHTCALETISAAGYINYFGKSLSVEKLELNPILLQKGDAKIALYGLGYIPHERLYRLFDQNKVVYKRPVDADDWFKIVVVHQNRVKHGTKYLPESFLTDFPDLVIWGHEHASFDHVEWVPNMFHIYQPGSTVATSLCAGEARPKHVGLLTVRNNGCENEFQLLPIKLRTTRLFYFESVNIDVLFSDLMMEATSDSVYEYCTQKIEDLLNRAAVDHSGDKRQPKEPLIKLRVDYSNEYFTFSSCEFGQQFIHRVANAKDIISFKLKKDRSQESTSIAEEEDFDELMDYDESAHYNIEDAIKEYFQRVDRKGQLNLLCENTLTEGVQLFVEKDASVDLIANTVTKSYSDTLKYLESLSSLDCEDRNAVAKAAFELKEKQKQNSTATVAELLKTVKPKQKTSEEIETDTYADDESFEEEPTPRKRQRRQQAGSSRGRGSRSSGRGRPRSRGGYRKFLEPLF